MEFMMDFSTELKEIFLTVHHIQRMEKGAYLFQEGASASELYFIQSGKVQVSKIIPDGRELTLRMCSDGDLVGELSLFSQSPKHSLNAKVVEGGEVAVIYLSDLEEKLAKNHELALEFIKWLSLEHRKTQTKFRDLILHGKKGALISTLIRLANSYGIKKKDRIVINANLTNQELANFCGTSREVVNRLLSELRKQNIISVDKGIITIYDFEYLKRENGCENCSIDICNIF